MKAWHFLRADGVMRDGRPAPADGELLRYTGPIRLCASGLHASVAPWDALQYAPGPIVCRVECGGEVIHGDDKLVCTERTILWRIDATDVLRRFARLCALDVVHLWDAPDVVVRYLQSGDESLRAAAWDAASNAAWDAAWDAARDAAWDAAWGAQSKRLARMLRDAHRGKQ